MPSPKARSAPIPPPPSVVSRKCLLPSWLGWARHLRDVNHTRIISLLVSFKSPKCLTELAANTKAFRRQDTSGSNLTFESRTWKPTQKLTHSNVRSIQSANKKARGSDRLIRTTSQAGIAAIEFGLLAPFLVLLLVAATEIGSGVYQAMQAQNAAEAGAVYASKHGFNVAGITGAVVNATAAGVAATPAPSQFCGCPVASGITEMGCTATCADGSAPALYVRINASLTRTSLISVSSLLLPTTFSGQAVIRQY
jgi:Flp pilus assembly protein TadG